MAVIAAACGSTSAPPPPLTNEPPLPPITGTFTTRDCVGCRGPTGINVVERLAPGSDRIAFGRTQSVESGDIYVAAADGSGEVRLTDAPGVDIAPAWSPDGARIVFASSRGGHGFDLYTMRDDGSDQSPLTTRAGDEFAPAWSPDGRLIAYIADYGLDREHVRVVRHDGTGDRKLVNGRWPSFAPDGRAILVTTGPLTAGRLQLVDVASGVAQPVPVDLPSVHEAAFSTDGRWIVFVASEVGFVGPSSRWNEELWRVRADGSGLERLTRRSGNDHFLPAMSPDGRSLAWTADDDQGSGDIYVMDIDGSNWRRLTNDGAYDAWPAWAPTPEPDR